jgi:hypothetical protein
VGQRGLVGGEGEASGRFTDRKQKKTVRAANAQNGQSTLSGAGGELCRGGDLLHGFSLAHLFCECKGFLLYLDNLGVDHTLNESATSPQIEVYLANWFKGWGCRIFDSGD